MSQALVRRDIFSYYAIVHGFDFLMCMAEEEHARFIGESMNAYLWRLN